uniref:Sugar transport protein 13-like n=1 Tax=Tetraselmis sp. GSL018 TaxID=582737 RepID=A0A061QXK6_9CHLO
MDPGGRPAAALPAETVQALSSIHSRSTDPDEDRPLNWKLLFVIVVASSAGSLFGYDLGVIGSIGKVPGFQEFYWGAAPRAEEQGPAPPQSPGVALVATACQDGVSVGVLLTISLFGSGMAGGLLGSYLTARLGRRRSIIIASATYMLGTCVEGLAGSVAMFYIGRVILGAGVGITNQAVPVYLAEIAPARNRGAIGISFQFFITFGILLATVVSFLVRNVPGSGGPSGHEWRWVLMIGALPSLLVMYGAVLLTDTPQYILCSGKDTAKAQAYYLLSKLRRSEDIGHEFQMMCLYCERRHSFLESWRFMFLDRRRLPPILVTTALVVFQQITFLNGFLFFLPSLFRGVMTSTDPENSELFASLTNSLLNFLATGTAVYVADRFGRRPLLIYAGFQLALAAVAMAVLTTTIPRTDVSDALAFSVITVVGLFVTAYAYSWGPLPWTIPAEINAWPWRSAGTSFAVIVNFAVSILAAGVFNSLLCAMGFGLFVLITVVVVVATVVAFLLIPETAHVDLNEAEFLFKGHWLWRRFYPPDEQIEALPRPTCAAVCCCCSSFPEEEVAEPQLEAPISQDTRTITSTPTLTELYGIPSSVKSGGSKARSFDRATP